MKIAMFHSVLHRCLTNAQMVCVCPTQEAAPPTVFHKKTFRGAGNTPSILVRDMVMLTATSHVEMDNVYHKALSVCLWWDVS